MKRTISSCEVSANQRGVFTILAAISMVALLGFSALAIDVGYLIYNQKKLDAATTAAALAGGQDLWSQTWTTVQTNATAYTAGQGKYNPLGNSITVNAPVITGLRLNSVALPWASATSTYNALRVTQTAAVPMFFAPILGFNTVNIRSSATASAGGGPAKPLNVVIVLDTTASMTGTKDPNCGLGANATKIDCARYGARTLMAQLTAAGDNVGLVVFPAVSSQLTASNNCPTYPSPVDYMLGSGVNAGIDATGSFSTLVALTNSSTYLTNGQIKKTSLLAQVLGVGTNSSNTACSGIPAPGGKGTYYAQAIKQAQANLCKMSGAAVTNNNQCTGTGNSQQNVMVILSDGDASSTAITGSTYDSNQCQQAIEAANKAKDAKTWVYSIAYMALNSGCSTDTGSNFSPLTNGRNVKACDTMKWLAGTTRANTKPTTLSSYFYSEDTTCAASTSNSSLSSIFQNIGAALMGSRLIPDDAT
jgi:Flp pilus assembly protein TadG